MSEIKDKSNSLATLLTPAGRGAVATIAVVAENVASIVGPLFEGANNKQLKEVPFRQISFGRWNSKNAVGEELVICRLSNSELEIHCHGGHAAYTAILDDLEEQGIRVLSSEQFFEQTKRSLKQEAADVLSKATTEDAAKHILQQYHGVLEQSLSEVLDRLRNGEQTECIKTIDMLLRNFQFAHRLTNPTRVVIAGPPNVGKSSLINSIAGYQRAIVFDQPGTTRDVVQVATAIDGFPVSLSDTAGIRDTSDPIESEGVARAKLQISQADVVLFVFDATSQWDETWYQNNRSLIGESQSFIRVFNKADLSDGTLTPKPDDILMSAKTCQGLERLLDAIASRINPDGITLGSPLPFATRHQHQLQKAKSCLLEGQTENAIEAIKRIIAF